MFFVLYTTIWNYLHLDWIKTFIETIDNSLWTGSPFGERRIFIAGRWEEGKWGNGRGHPFPFGPYYLTIAFLPFPQLRSLVPG